jgi:hypothetical protein
MLEIPAFLRRFLLSGGLEAERFAVGVTADGRSVIDMSSAYQYDLVNDLAIFDPPSGSAPD